MDAEALPVPGGYEVRELLGQGSSSVVYRAWQSEPRRAVALKIGRAAAPPAAGAVPRLDHPHIVPVYEAGEHRGRPFLCMRLVEGRSLARLLHQGPLDPRVAAWLVACVARAVHHAHQRGVCHGLLNPPRSCSTRWASPPSLASAWRAGRRRGRPRARRTTSGRSGCYSSPACTACRSRTGAGRPRRSIPT
jgi:hypothetical protein